MPSNTPARFNVGEIPLEELKDEFAWSATQARFAW